MAIVSMVRVALAGLLVAGAAVIGATPAVGATPGCTTSWKAAASGAWSTAANWTAGVPTSTADACITVAGTYTVTVSSFGNAARAINLGGASGTQTLDLRGNCTNNTATLVANADSVVGARGVLDLDTAGCANGTFQVNGSTLTNNGVITMTNPSNLQAWPNFSAATVNNGTMNFNAVSYVHDALTNNGTINLGNNEYVQVQGDVVNNGAVNATGAGTLAILQAAYTQGSGTTSGTHPVEINQGSFNDTGKGKSTVTIVSDGVPFTGNIAKGQTVVLDASCTNHFTGLAIGANWTNRGTLLLESDGACFEHARIYNAQTFTNLGTVRVMPESTSNATSDINGGTVKNNATFEIGAGATLTSPDAQFVNGKHATLTVDIASASAYGSLQWSTDPQTFRAGGTLGISTAPGYWPAAGTTFPIVHSGKPVKKFTTVTGATRSGRATSYHVGYTTTGVNLTT